MLDAQVHCYCIDTACFSTDEERIVYNRLSNLRRHKKQLVEIKNRMKEKHKVTREYVGDETDFAGINEAVENKYHTILERTQLNPLITETKNQYLELLKQNKETRTLDPIHLKESRVVSVFESSFTRAAGFSTNTLTEDFFIIEVYYFDVMRQIMRDGFYYNDEKYVFAWASAGQIRTKKIVMAKESMLKKVLPVLMCGLTEDKINKAGGMNTAKFMVYLALSSSATDPAWFIDIDHTIVIDDYEVVLKDREVDYVDYRDYSVTRKKMDVEIDAIDGIGLISPEIYDRNTMIRGPWIKGLLAKFDFKEFIREFGGSRTIVDIYGQEHDVFAENITCILTKSQFKMWKFYSSWDEYKKAFKANGCEFGYCNPERDILPHATLSYQPLQTITEFVEEDVDRLVRKSNDTLRRISTEKTTMLRVFGADPLNDNKSALQEALSLYPEMLQDPYCRFKLRQIKESLVRKYKAGKLEINGRYLFLIPDMFAACWYWFIDKNDVVTLLSDGEVYSKVYKYVDKLCLIRSPHLYREHCIRKNVDNDLTDKYFDTSAIYVSVDDMITQVLMADFDGDVALTVADRHFVKLAERNLQKDDIVPLQYELKKATTGELTSHAKIESILATFATTLIGQYANKITKIWSNVDWSSLTDEERKRHLQLIACLTQESNVSIDSAKTQWFVEAPEDVAEEIRELTKTKVPHFFKYAKKRADHQVEPVNNNIVNLLESKIVNPRLNFKECSFGKMNSYYLMRNPNIEIDERIINKYTEVGKQYHYRLNIKEEDFSPSNINIVALNIRSEIEAAAPDLEWADICDILTRHLFIDHKGVSKKDLYWQICGWQVVENLRHNLEKATKNCEICNARFVPGSNRQKFCIYCAKEQRTKKETLRKRKMRAAVAVCK